MIEQIPFPVILAGGDVEGRADGLALPEVLRLVDGLAEGFEGDAVLASTLVGFRKDDVPLAVGAAVPAAKGLHVLDMVDRSLYFVDHCAVLFRLMS